MEDYFYIILLLLEYNTLNGGIDMLVKTDRYIFFSIAWRTSPLREVRFVFF